MAVEFADFLAVGHDGAHAGAREERGNAGAAGAQLLGQRALRGELKLEFARQVLAFEFLVFAHVGRNHLAHLARVQQLAQAKAVNARVVADAGQVLHA
ncbi:hypothetical protein D3C73_823370 [compost metagenome]